MSLRYQDLIAPNPVEPDCVGDLEISLFPLQTPEDSFMELQRRVDALLVQANQETVGVAPSRLDEAAGWFVRWRIYKAVVQIMLRAPTDTTLDAGKRNIKFDMAQIQEFMRERDRAEKEFRDLLPEADEAEPIARSNSIRMKVRL